MHNQRNDKHHLRYISLSKNDMNNADAEVVVDDQ